METKGFSDEFYRETLLRIAKRVEEQLGLSNDARDQIDPNGNWKHLRRELEQMYGHLGDPDEQTAEAWVWDWIKNDMKQFILVHSAEIKGDYPERTDEVNGFVEEYKKCLEKNK